MGSRSARDLEPLDLVRQHRGEYAAPETPTLIDILPASYLSATGQGAPGGSAFAAALSALYSVAYTIKMAHKQTGQDYRVAPLEGLWWTEDGIMPPVRPDDWCYQLLIRVPDFVVDGDVASAVATLQAKRKPITAGQVRRERLDEGRCVQVLHVGPYDAETATLQAMAAYARSLGLELYGRHHEIYISDPNRVPPARLRTILRHPVRTATPPLA